MISKEEIRRKNKEKRSKISRAEVGQKSSAAAKVFILSEIYKDAKCIMLYSPLGNETDTSEIIESAFCDGKKIVLPVTDQNSGQLTPVIVTKNTTFKKGAFSVSEPIGAEKAKTSEIDVVVVPGIAFDKKGNRIGFGKGCYDKLLYCMSAIKVGFCYDFQVLDEIPSDGHDIKMDYLITEKGLI